MFRYFRWDLAFLPCLIAVVWLIASDVSGQSTAKGVTCPAAGSSIQVASAKGSRLSLSIINDLPTNSVRFAGTISPSSTPNLDDTNSTILLPGASYSFNLPGLYYGRVVCMSTTATPILIHVTETTYP